MSTDGRRGCAICGHAQGATLEVREMMFGTRDSFRYFVCDECGCCQLRDPIDPSHHYPPDYDAHRVQPRPTGIRGALRHLRSLGVFRGSAAGLALNRLVPYPVYGAENWFRRMGVGIHDRILDVGCGSGELLRDLRDAGFSHAEGLDPFVSESVAREIGIHRIALEACEGQYDVIMLHHVFEHVPRPIETLRHVERLLRPGGRTLVRMPIMPSAAWERYGVNWFQLDAPRHLFIHTERSFASIAGQAGFTIDHVEHDSTEFQFAGSELYEQDLPLSSLPSVFSSSRLKAFRRRARALNRERRGDQAAFYLRKA